MPEEFYTKCYLLNGVDLDEDYEYTIDFDDETSQYNFFYAKKQLPITDLDFSYIRAEQPFKVDYKLSELEDIDYLMYQNEENEKWYYAFITKKEYVNPETTRLYVKLDVMQTYMFDYELKESFVDREHQDRVDMLGKPIYNIEQENLEIGSDYELKDETLIDTTSENSTDNNLFYLIKAKEPLGNDSVIVSADNGLIPDSKFSHNEADGTCKVIDIRTNIYLYLLPITRKTTGNYIKIKRDGSINPDVWVNTDPYAYQIFEDDRVIEVSIIRYLPEWYEGYSNDSDVGSYAYHFNNRLSGRFDFTMYSKYNSCKLLRIKNLNANENLDNITTLYRWRKITESDILPISQPTPDYTQLKDIKYESKLKTYPYQFIRVNAYGETKDYKYENFENNANFSLYLGVGTNGGSIIRPDNYNKGKNMYDSVEIKLKNTITLRTDEWLKYELNNKASLNGGLITNIGKSVATIGLGLATGGIGLAVAGTQAIGTLAGVANEMIKREDIKSQPDDIRATLCDTELTESITGLYIKLDYMGIKDIFMQKLYNYFYHYGYKCNDFKIPNIRSRYYFNYIKTIGVNLTSDISGEYKQTLKDIFNRGITIWHYRNADTFKGVNNFDYENAEMALI